MSNFEEHIEFRKSRYYKFTKSKHFNQALKGLHHIELNIAETCTRRCLFCPRADTILYPNKREFMSLDTLDIFLQRCKEENYLEEIHFTGFGESLCHPNIEEIFSLLKNKKLSNFINLTTNGDLFKKIHPSKLYENGITHITVSCYDGQEQYEYFSNILKETSNSYYIRKLWKNYISENNFLDRTHKSLNTSGSCFFPFYKMFIDYDGRVLLCSNDWFRQTNFNLNIINFSLQEIWYSNQLSQYRQQLLQNKRLSSPCSTCNVNGTLIGKESANLF